jgi:hypothetical protein
VEHHGPLPTTVTSTTGGGGRHLYFRAPTTPIGNTAGRLGPGVDVRADRGCVVAPPSPHASGGTYSWAPGLAPEETPLEELPEWLLHLLSAGRSGGRGPHAPLPQANLRFAALRGGGVAPDRDGGDGTRRSEARAGDLRQPHEASGWRARAPPTARSGRGSGTNGHQLWLGARGR